LEAEALHVRWQDIRNEVLAQLDLIAHELDLLGGIVVQQHPNGRSLGWPVMEKDKNLLVTV